MAPGTELLPGPNGPGGRPGTGPRGHNDIEGPTSLVNRNGAPDYGDGPPTTVLPGGRVRPGAPVPPRRDLDDAPTELIEPETEIIDLVDDEDDYPREPQLLTHREPDDDEYDHHSEDDDEEHDDEDRELTEEEERALRKKKIWRRVRRGCYIAAAVGVIGPIVAFVITYFLVEIDDPKKVIADQEKTVTLLFADGQSEMSKLVPQGGTRAYVSHGEVPKIVLNAVTATEDASFYTNPGFDVVGIARAVLNQITAGVGGGSGITQQYIKVSTGDKENSLGRKWKELVKSFKMSNEQTKEQIMEAYLNTIPFGRGALGIDAGARALLGKSVKEISDPAEAALLATVIQAPYRLDPDKNKDATERRWRKDALRRMAENGYITQDQAANLTFPTTVPRAEAMKRNPVSGPTLHIQEQVVAELESMGYTDDKLKREGLTVVTTIDKDAQKHAEKAIAKYMKNNKEGLRTAFTAVDPKTGGVRAYYGGENGTGVDYADSLQEPGSSFKPFVALAALQKGIGIGTPYDGTSGIEILGKPRHNSGNKSLCGPQCSIRDAMTLSVNTVFMKIAADLTPKRVVEAALSAGVPKSQEKGLLGSDGFADINVAIGGGDTRVRPRDMAGAYATFAADGESRPTHFVSRVMKAGQELPLWDEKKEVVAKTMLDANDLDNNKQLSRNVTETMLDVAKSSSLALAKNRPSASKTGTHELDKTENAKAWMVGFTPQISASVWVGRDLNEPLRGDCCGARNHPIYGKDEPGHIWKEFMDTYLSNVRPEPFQKATPIGQYDDPVTTTTAPSSTTPLSSTPPSGSSTPNSPSSPPCTTSFWNPTCPSSTSKRTTTTTPPPDEGGS
ncbi:penicillin-binding protein [Allokutzneria sp. A3M-2-11 16]|uniref:transglycosylase domain-containing protein n=1 Tax=Allokutzneria sp. A3M-2-11 16 TaxID=2962043 RepID=UPI0020B716AF|nr:transglycosylase domain-containing protein [Allokutzneria sp. A3M-2-11 16]MCP3802044.1 penicillin-binding protein [Allokutzneria sp. A3M-2-11 16]